MLRTLLPCMDGWKNGIVIFFFFFLPSIHPLRGSGAPAIKKKINSGILYIRLIRATTRGYLSVSGSRV